MNIEFGGRGLRDVDSGRCFEILEEIKKSF